MEGKAPSCVFPMVWLPHSARVPQMEHCWVKNCLLEFSLELLTHQELLLGSHLVLSGALL